MSQSGGPGAGVLTTDISNAFGAIRRSVLLAEVLRSIPSAAPFLLTLWFTGARVLQRVGAEYNEFTVTDGLWQGDSWSAFCHALGKCTVTRQLREKIAG